MTHELMEIIRARRLRERCVRGVAMVAPVDVGEGGLELLFSTGIFPRQDIHGR